ncbi:15495_t:CDS:2 [Acaulospora morrowiae]|uniref:15495_t:CDS:1 n=1 Tax=Acaulospora morrowiae TaxID=94023 RepID=A0A9N9HCS7_9GLOM|nr:15495_t:CDS:2 [Acaulospora morrowiae]
MSEKSKFTGILPSSSEKLDYNDDTSIYDCYLNEHTTVFHVHMPELGPYYIPAILGSCESLGNWNKENPKVFLRNVGDSTLWISDPVLVPNYIEVRYKYAIFSISRRFFPFGFRSTTIFENYEGVGEQSNRLLELRENHYDIWINNITFRTNHVLLEKEYSFVRCIYERITSENLKDKIIEYQRIHEDYSSYTRLATNLEFIKDRLINSNIKESRYFLFLLLGYYMSQAHKQQYDGICLPRHFPSDMLFEVLDDLTLISGTKRYVILSIKALTEHSSKYGSLEWFRMFTIAPEHDEEYTFLEAIVYYDYSVDPGTFQKSLLDHVQPHISEIKQNDELFRRVAMKLLGLSYDLKSLFFILNDVIGLDERLKLMVEKRIRELIAHDNLFQLRRRLQEFHNESRFDTKIIFLERLVKLLQCRDTRWENCEIVFLNDILREQDLNWPIEDLIKILECVAFSDQLSLLQNFLIILEFTLGQVQDSKSPLINKALATSYTWLPKLTTLLTSKGNDPSILAKNIAFVTLANFSFVYTMVKDWSHICEELKKIFEPDVIKHYVTLAKARLDHDVWDINNHLLREIMLICDSTRLLHIRNKICEELLYHIFDCFQKNAFERFYTEDTYNLQISILESSYFWKTIFLSSGSTEKLYSHPFVKKTRDILINLATEIAENSLTIGLLEDILRIYSRDQKNFIDLVNSALGDRVELMITDNTMNILLL